MQYYAIMFNMRVGSLFCQTTSLVNLLKRMDIYNNFVLLHNQQHYHHFPNAKIICEPPKINNGVFEYDKFVLSEFDRLLQIDKELLDISSRKKFTNEEFTNYYIREFSFLRHLLHEHHNIIHVGMNTPLSIQHAMNYYTSLRCNDHLEMRFIEFDEFNKKIM